MKRRDSIRLKAAVIYLFRISAIVLLIILLFALIAWVSNPIILKGVFAFFAVETFILYIYMIISIYKDERNLSQNILDKLKFSKKQEYESIMFHHDGDFKIVIPQRNVELLKRMPEKFIFLNKSDWLKLYKLLISKYNNENKTYLIYFDSENANLFILRKHYLKKGDRYYLM